MSFHARRRSKRVHKPSEEGLRGIPVVGFSASPYRVQILFNQDSQRDGRGVWSYVDDLIRRISMDQCFLKGNKLPLFFHQRASVLTQVQLTFSSWDTPYLEGREAAGGKPNGELTSGDPACGVIDYP